ncbi:MAG: hypothetical protein U5K71_17020 [Gracilimonas sp.]|nr:hypothetical protein [Gracilimonas sp.]
MFQRKTFTIDINVIGGGQVEFSPTLDQYEYETEVTLTAVPEPDWQFLGWSVDVNSNDNPITFTVNSDLSITVNFEEQSGLFNGGNGSELYPYKVSDIYQFQLVREYPEAYFVQTNDINVSVALTWDVGQEISDQLLLTLPAIMMEIIIKSTIL